MAQAPASAGAPRAPEDANTVPSWLTVLVGLGTALVALAGVFLGHRLSAKRELTQAEQSRADHAAERRVEAYVRLRVASWQLRANIAAGDENAAIASTIAFMEAVETVALIASPDVRDAAYKLRDVIDELLNADWDNDAAVDQAETQIEEISRTLLDQMRRNVAGYL